MTDPECYSDGNSVIYFPLKGRAQKDGLFASVSVDKWPLVRKYDWYLGQSGYPICYTLHKMQLHRFIYQFIFEGSIPSNIFVDHIDRDKLNNTNENLRLATPQENSFNRSTKTDQKGVRKISDNSYIASVTKNGIKHEIRDIATAEEAANIYNMMAEELFGEFAAPNQIY